MANTAVFGIYPDRATAEDAFKTLRTEGFREADVSALVPENLGTKDFGHEKSSKAPEGAVMGGLIGALLAGVLGWFAGSDQLRLPQELSRLLLSGPWFAAAAGIGAGALIGGLIGAIAGAGIPEYEAKRYSGRVRNRSVLVSVHADDRSWVSRAKTVLKHTGGQQIGVAREARADFRESERPQIRVS